MPQSNSDSCNSVVRPVFFVIPGCVCLIQNENFQLSSRFHAVGSRYWGHCIKSKVFGLVLITTCLTVSFFSFLNQFAFYQEWSSSAKECGCKCEWLNFKLKIYSMLKKIALFMTTNWFNFWNHINLQLIRNELTQPTERMRFPWNHM